MIFSYFIKNRLVTLLMLDGEIKEYKLKMDQLKKDKNFLYKDHFSFIIVAFLLIGMIILQRGYRISLPNH